MRKTEDILKDLREGLDKVNSMKDLTPSLRGQTESVLRRMVALTQYAQAMYGWRETSSCGLTYDETEIVTEALNELNIEALTISERVPEVKFALRATNVLELFYLLYHTGYIIDEFEYFADFLSPGDLAWVLGGNQYASSTNSCTARNIILKAFDESDLCLMHHMIRLAKANRPTEP